MSIKSGELASASDLNALKSALLTLYANRTVSTNGRQLSSTTTAPYSTVNAINATTGSSILATQKGVIDGILVINDLPNLLTQAQNNEILANGVSSTTLLDWVNQYKDASSNSKNHGCRGACVGICTGGCSGTLRGDTGSHGKACDGCTWGCWGSCQGGNGSGVGQVCTCEETCYSSCYGSCSGDSCKHDCTGVCGYGGCGTQCRNTCMDSCDDGCDGSCATDCKQRCYGNATGGCYGCSGKNNA